MPTRSYRADVPDDTHPNVAARLSAAVAEAIAGAWLAVAAYRDAGIAPPVKFLRFLGEPIPARQTGRTGLAPAVWGPVRRWFVGRGNRTATADQIAAGTGLARDQVDRLIHANMRHRFVKARVAGTGKLYEYRLADEWLELSGKEES